MKPTRDEILNEPAGPRMNSWVSVNVMGLPDIPLFGAPCPYCGGEMWHGRDRSRCTACGEWRRSPYKEYSSDDAAALEVLGHITPDSSWSLLLLRGKGERVYECTIHRTDGGKVHASADTPALAICRAALLAVMEAE